MKYVRKESANKVKNSPLDRPEKDIVTNVILNRGHDISTKLYLRLLFEIAIITAMGFSTLLVFMVKVQSNTFSLFPHLAIIITLS